MEFLNYKGDKLPFRISYFALKKSEENLKEGEKFDINDFSVMENLCYYALIAGHKAEDLEIKFQKDDIEFILDDPQNMTKFVNEFAKLSPPQEDKKKFKQDQTKTKK